MMMPVTLTEVTQFALPAIGTEALERVDAIDTCPAVSAGAAHTVVDI